MIVDLRSDTVTRPSKEMYEAMLSAPVGDDVFGEDPTVNKLEEKLAAMFGMEAGLYCSSGTQSNQIAVKAHTQPGDEIICHRLSHIYYYEGGGIAFNSGVSTCLLDGDRGMITAAQVADNINPDDVHRPVTRMVSVENTMNKGGGTIYDFNELLKIGEVCHNNNLSYHLDGARLFNALAETTQTTADYGKLFDSISICLSKGLGAPVGSVLLGKKDFIKKGRRIRKVLGGGMRQAGILAAAGIYALDNHVKTLKEDHRRALVLAETFQKASFISQIIPAETNMVFATLDENHNAEHFVQYLQQNGVYVLSLANRQVRVVTHRDITDNMLEKASEVILKYR